jgi:hypothetical protein
MHESRKENEPLLKEQVENGQASCMSLHPKPLYQGKSVPGYSVPLHLGCAFSAIFMGTV